MSDVRLAGRSVLVIEDDFYLAEDVRRALEDAGATVVGPVDNADDARALVEQAKPDCAVVDINLGSGPDFRSATMLRGHDVPLLFVTGYDANTVPAEFADAPRLQKPTNAAKLIAAVAALVR